MKLTPKQIELLDAIGKPKPGVYGGGAGWANERVLALSFQSNTFLALERLGLIRFGDGQSVHLTDAGLQVYDEMLRRLDRKGR